MASPAFFHTCAVYNNITKHDDHHEARVLVERVVTIVAMTFCIISLLVVIYLLLPRDVRGSEWWRNPGRILVGPNLNAIIRAVVITSFLGTLGILVRSAVEMNENFPGPSEVVNGGHIFCIVINVLIEYFYESSYFWIILYAIEALMAANNKELPTAVKYILGWIMPGIVCGSGLLLLYHNGIKEYDGKTEIERAMLYFIFLLPILLVLICNPFLFYFASKAAKRALIWHYGRYTASERKLIDSIHFKFILILAAFLTSWLPNIIDAVIHMAQNDNKTAKLTIWIIMCVLNPLQPVLCALVLWGLPESRISFSSWWNNTSTDLSDISSSNVNFSRSTSSETEPLISFRRKERK